MTTRTVRVIHRNKAISHFDDANVFVECNVQADLHMYFPLSRFRGSNRVFPEIPPNLEPSSTSQCSRIHITRIQKTKFLHIVIIQRSIRRQGDECGLSVLMGIPLPS